MDSTHLQELERTVAEIRQTDDLRQADITQLANIWRGRLSPEDKEEELFDLCDTEGTPTGLTAPRWLCHLLGLRHRAVHIILRSPQNLLVLQVRSHNKADWPDHIDTSVGGHLRAGQDFYAGAISEMEEELGLPADRLALWLAGGALEPVGVPYTRSDCRPSNPPFRNNQVNRIYTGRLTTDGMTQIHFRDGEVSALYLCSAGEADRLLAESTRVAPGLANSLPRYIAWCDDR